MNEKWLLFQKVRSFRGSPFSQCFILSTALYWSLTTSFYANNYFEWLPIVFTAFKIFSTTEPTCDKLHNPPEIGNSSSKRVFVLFFPPFSVCFYWGEGDSLNSDQHLKLVKTVWYNYTKVKIVTILTWVYNKLKKN